MSQIAVTITVSLDHAELIWSALADVRSDAVNAADTALAAYIREAMDKVDDAIRDPRAPYMGD